MRTRTRTSTVLLTLVMLLFAVAGPAQAHQTSVTLEVDGGWKRQSHVAAAGTWTFTVEAMEGKVSSAIIWLVKEGTCPPGGYPLNECDYVFNGGLKGKVGSQISVPDIEAGSYEVVLRTWMGGKKGSTITIGISHPDPILGLLP